jgi:hypothetical protein
MLISAFSLSSFARIGESLEECKKRYDGMFTLYNEKNGKEYEAPGGFTKDKDKRSGLDVYQFRKLYGDKDIAIKIIFYEKKAIYVEYVFNFMRFDNDTDPLIDKLVNVNGKNWKKLTDKSEGNSIKPEDSDDILSETYNSGSIWICDGGLEKGGLKAIYGDKLIIIHAKYKEIVEKKKGNDSKKSEDVKKKDLDGF